MNRDIRQFASHHLGTVEVQYDPILKGGSDRAFYRVRVPSGATFIFMEFGTEVEENAYWAEINRFMTEIGIPVPRIIAYDSRRRFMLLEDLGDADLYSLRDQPWRKRRRCCLMALSAIHRLHRTPIADVPDSLQLCRGYDRPLYAWEHAYFRENFVEAVCGLSLSGPQERDWAEEMEALIDRLQKIPECLIHRDFQSQNIMIRNDRPVLLDFQGMRKGNLFYDLASLICDPYVSFSPSERNELVAFYYRIMEPDYSFEKFTGYFWEGAVQRLMQALGAYGFLGLKKNKPAFLPHMANGLKNLLTAVDNAGGLATLSRLLPECKTILARKNY